MDFYIRTFECVGYGVAAESNYSDNQAILISPMHIPKYCGTIRIKSYDKVAPSTHSMRYILFNKGYLPFPQPPDIPDQIPTYQNGSDITNFCITEYPVTDTTDIMFGYYRAGGLPSGVGFTKENWDIHFWTTTNDTFENQLCNMFYSIVKNQPSSTSTFGTNFIDTNLYLYKLNLIDMPDYPDIYIPIFMKGNDPAYDRIYTAQEIT